MATLAACLAAALAAAAADAATPKRAKSVQDLATLFSTEDYPAEALRSNEEGRTGFRLTVGPDGKPSRCTIESSSGSVSLDAATCRLLMERARFEPARDRRGRAVTDQVSSHTRWVLGGETPSRPQAAMMLWTSCVMGEVSKLALGSLPPADVVARAFPPCAALEAVLAREMETPLPVELRSQLAPGIESVILEARTVLNAPREPAPPESP